MREIITLMVCLVIFLIALQSGLIKTGLDYDTIVKTSENLQSANERLTQEIKQVNLAGGGGNSLTAISAGGTQWQEKKLEIKQALKNRLATEIKNREIVIEENEAGVRIVMLDKFLFKKRTDALLETSQGLLLKIAESLNGLDTLELHIIGYTDNQPLTAEMGRRFSNLRQLSAARAIVIADFMNKPGKLDPVQIMTGGFGEVRPVAPNDSEFHRTLNGRIEISFFPVAAEELNQSRDIYRTELSVPAEKEKTKKNKRKVVSAEEETPEPISVEPVGEEELNRVNGTEFNAGYAKPKE